MNKWTPGPWFVVGQKIYRRPEHELYEYGGGVAGDKPLAKAYEAWEEKGFPVEANARLISAAPDMYEALAGYISHFDSEESDEEVKDWLDNYGLWKMRKALKKARGES